MARGEGILDRTTVPVWDVSGVWGDGTGTTAKWPSYPAGFNGARVGIWNVSVWNESQVVWGPASSIGTTTRFDPYDGTAVWDSGQYWESDFWLTW